MFFEGQQTQSFVVSMCTSNVIMAINSRLVTYSHVHTSSWWWDEQVCLKRRKMHVILCRVVLYIKRKNFFTVCNWCLLSACVSNLCVSCETLHCLAQALSGFCTWMWYIWNTQFVLFFIFHNQKYWIVLQMLQPGCCTWMWCMWNTHCVSKNQLCSSCLSIFEYPTLLYFSPASGCAEPAPGTLSRRFFSARVQRLLHFTMISGILTISGNN